MAALDPLSFTVPLNIYPSTLSFPDILPGILKTRPRFISLTVPTIKHYLIIYKYWIHTIL